jgi:hypothetical protein
VRLDHFHIFATEILFGIKELPLQLTRQRLIFTPTSKLLSHHEIASHPGEKMRQTAVSLVLPGKNG